MPSRLPIFEVAVFKFSGFRNLSCCRNALLVLLLFLSACSTQTKILGENEHYLVLVAGESETFTNLAATFLGDPEQDWRIEDANGTAVIEPGQQLVIPRTVLNPTGIHADGYQTVPILSYHRFGTGKGKLSITKRKFRQQMEYLKQNGYRIISLQQLLAFLRNESDIPQHSVVLTIDDGYRSVYEIAYPILKMYQIPATIFIYSDYIGNGGLTWRQMKEMEASGLISFQAHSKTHDNLTLRLASESKSDYHKRLASEVRIPFELLESRLQNPQLSFAYPYGAVNRQVVDELRRSGYKVGVTVDRGANPFFTFPYALRRTMIYEKDGMAEFEQSLRVFESRNLK